MHEFEHVGSADLGQHQVKQNQIGNVVGENINGNLTILGTLKMKAFALQPFLVQTLRNRVVLNKENGFYAHHGFKCISAHQLCGERVTWQLSPGWLTRRRHRSCFSLTSPEKAPPVPKITCFLLCVLSENSHWGDAA
jgi:hypothetical protein